MLMMKLRSACSALSLHEAQETTGTQAEQHLIIFMQEPLTEEDHCWREKLMTELHNKGMVSH